MQFKGIILILFILLSCSKEKKVTLKVVGHGGNGLEYSGSIYHGNSKEAMCLALDTPKSDGVELDLRMGADGVLWLSHDESLDVETNSTGCIGDKYFDELKDVHYSTLKKEALVRLEDIDLFQTTDKFIFLDVKHANACQNTIQNVDHYLESLNKWRLKLKSPSQNVFAILANRDWIGPFIAAGWKVLFSSEDEELRDKIVMDFPSINGFVCKNQFCTKEQVETFKSQGKDIYLYEVRSPKALKEVRSKKPTGVLSDDLQGAIVEFK